MKRAMPPRNPYALTPVSRLLAREEAAEEVEEKE